MARRNETDDERAARKAAAKAAKAEKRAERQGLGDPAKGRKPCSLCARPRDLLIRCQVDSSATWHMACGKCWMAASGGAVDGSADRPYYRYGGLWKNHHKAGSGKNKVPAAAKATVTATANTAAVAATGRGVVSERLYTEAGGAGGSGGVHGSSADRRETGLELTQSLHGIESSGRVEEGGLGGSGSGTASDGEGLRGRGEEGREEGGRLWGQAGRVPAGMEATRALLLREAALCEEEDRTW